MYWTLRKFIKLDLIQIFLFFIAQLQWSLLKDVVSYKHITAEEDKENINDINGVYTHFNANRNPLAYLQTK